MNLKFFTRFFLFIESFLFAVVVRSCRLKTANSGKINYNYIQEFSPNVNAHLKTFLINSQSYKGRKTAVFDCDGTLLGQVPHYLADEAMFEYANSHFQNKVDSLSKAKMKILKRRVKDKAKKAHLVDRINFFAGLPVDSVEEWGEQVYKTHYEGKLYSGMLDVVTNLQNFGFQIWIVTASPELIYQQIMSDTLGIPKNQVIGIKSIIRHGIVSNQIISPIPEAAGKAETISTFIETEPLFVAGNSVGDVAMIKQSAGLKWIINPNNETQVPSLDDMTLREYAKTQRWERVYITDQLDDSIQFVSDKWKIPVNKTVKR